MRQNRHRAACLLVALCGLAVLPGCLSAEDMAAIREAAVEARAGAQVAREVAGDLRAEIDGLVADYRAMQADAEQSEEAREAAARIASEIERKQAELDAWLAKADAGLEEYDAHLARLSEARDGFDVAEVAIGALATFVPGAAVGIPFIRRLRANLDGTVAAIAAGGGPANPEAAKAAMLASGVKPAVDKARRRVGDKA